MTPLEQALGELKIETDKLDAFIASRPQRESVPNRCRCPCYGCKHHCSAHDPHDIEET